MSKIKFEINGTMLYTDDSVVSFINNPRNTSVLKFTHLQVIELLHQYIKELSKINNINILADVLWERNNDNYIFIDVHLSDSEGNPLSDYLYKTISDFAGNFVNATYVGNDVYETHNKINKTNAGTPIITDCYAIYITNKPLYGSTPHLINKIRDMIENPTDGKVLNLNDIFDLLKEFFEEKNIIDAIAYIKSISK